MHNSISLLSDHFSRTIEHATHLVFPPRCLGCDRYLTSRQDRNHPDPDIAQACPTCRPTIYRLDAPGCPQCARPRLDFPGKPAPGVDDLCAACLDRPPAFEKAWACFEYEGIIAESIASIKYAQQLHKTRTLTRLTRSWMLDKLSTIQESHASSSPICLIPVPMHIHDLRKRGFNPAALLLRQLTHKTPYTVQLNILQKTRLTPSQAGLARIERLKNLAGAFTSAPPTAPNTTAVIFDDVLTTTATAHEVSTTLLNAGFARVFVLAIARATGTGRLSDYY